MNRQLRCACSWSRLLFTIAVLVAGLVFGCSPTECNPDRALLLDFIRKHPLYEAVPPEINRRIDERGKMLEPAIISLIEDIVSGKVTVKESNKALCSLAGLLGSEFAGTELSIPALRGLIGHSDPHVRETALCSLYTNFSLQAARVLATDGLRSRYNSGKVGNVKRRSIELINASFRWEEEVSTELRYVNDRYKESIKSPEALNRVSDEIAAWFEGVQDRIHVEYDKERERNVLVLTAKPDKE